VNQHDKLRIAIKYWLHGKGYSNAVRAMEVAAEYHTGLRKDKSTPEFHHQVCIASYIRTLPALLHTEDTLCTAFLHDLVEDYNVDLGRIEAKFGKVVRESVALMSKKVNGYVADPKSYYMNMRNNPIASVVKGADRMHNFQTMPGVFTPDKQRQYIQECTDYILPMLKAAKKNFPEQEPAYESVKHVLLSQIGLLEVSLENTNES
jgi:(p)ppGpp synthase/HD superfamily hydrolase